MTRTAHRRMTRPLVVRCAAALAACAVGGCISYSPREVSAMSTYELCEAQLYQGVNLRAETRQRVSQELARRQDDCRSEMAAIEAEHELQRDDDMYGRSGP